MKWSPLSPSDTLYTSTQNVMSGSVLVMSREKGGCQVRVMEEQLVSVANKNNIITSYLLNMWPTVDNLLLLKLVSSRAKIIMNFSPFPFTNCMLSLIAK